MSQNPNMYMFFFPGIKGLKSSSPSLMFDAMIYAPASPKHSPKSFPILVKLCSSTSVSNSHPFFLDFMNFRHLISLFFQCFLSDFFFASSSKTPMMSSESLHSFIGFFEMILILSSIHSIGVTTRFYVSLLNK